MFNFPKVDFWIAGPVIILIIISLTTLASINPVYLRSQSISLIIGIVAFFLLSHINFKALSILKMPFYISSVILLVLVLFAGIESRGSVRWVELFGIRFQFSELLKPVIAISFASYLSELHIKSFKSFLKMNLLMLPILLLIYFQPDLGSAIIYAAVFYLVLLTVGYSYKWFALLLVPLISISPLFWNLLHDYQKQRIITFLDPLHDPAGASYNSIQAIIAIGSGMFMGKGMGDSTQSGLRFLPERQTDFIFATISEGLGFVGSILLLTAFLFLFFRLFKIFTETNQIFDKVIVLSCFYFIFVQFIFNVGMNLGLLPVVGITLPFVSFGGSSLISNFIFLAMVNSIYFEHKKKQILEIR